MLGGAPSWHSHYPALIGLVRTKKTSSDKSFDNEDQRMPRLEHFLHKTVTPRVSHIFSVSEFGHQGAMNVVTKEGHREYPRLRSLEDFVHEHLDPCPLTLASGVV